MLGVSLLYSFYFISSHSFAHLYDSTYLNERKREREREKTRAGGGAEREGEAGSLLPTEQEPDVGLNPRTLG